MKKRLALALAIALIIPARMVMRRETSRAEALPDREEVQAAEAIIFDKELPEDPTDLADGNYRLTKNVTTPITIAEEATVNLNLNGFTVDGGTAGSAIYVDDSAKLSLYDTAGTGKVTGKKGTHNSGITGGAGVFVMDDATFELYGGTIMACEITASSATDEIAGAGVFLKDGAVFRMAGGTITGCRLNPASGKLGMGAGVYAAGNVVMSGGIIDSNGGAYVNGGGVYLAQTGEDMLMEMSGGRITGNIAATGRGNGIYIAAGALRLSGTADVSAQAYSGEDIRFASVPTGTTPNYKLAHRMPTKSGFVFELHEGSSTGTNLTETYRSDTWKSLTTGLSLYVVWRSIVTPTPASTGTPTVIPPSGDMTPTASPMETATGPAVTMTPTPTPTPTATPTPTPVPSYGPGEGMDSAEYQALSTADRKTADELVTRDKTLSYYTSARMVTYAGSAGIAKKELLLTDSVIKQHKAEGDPAGTTYGKLKLRVKKRAKTSVTLTWKKVSGADGYVIYGNRCGKKRALKYIRRVDGTVTKLKLLNLKKATRYQFLVRAYHNLDDGRMTVAAGACVHAYTKGSRKYTVEKGLRLYEKYAVGTGDVMKKNPSLVLEPGDTLRIGATVVKEEKKKKLKVHRAVCFESMKPAVVTIDKKTGKLKAKARGKVAVFVYAQNGVFKKLTITVR